MKKKMRMVLILLMAAVMSAAACISLSGCNSNTYRGDFFNQKHLEEHLVPDLPKPNCDILKDMGEELTLTMSKDEFDTYAKEIFKYLQACNFQRLGTRRGYSAGLFGTQYRAFESANIEDCYIEHTLDDCIVHEYIFAWANERAPRVQNEILWHTHYLILTHYSNEKFSSTLGMCYSTKLGFSFVDICEE